MDASGLTRVRLCGTPPPRVEWALDLEVSVPTGWARQAGSACRDGQLDLGAVDTTSAAAIAQDLRLRAAFIDASPQSARLPFRYHHVPAALRTFIAGRIGRRLRDRQHEWARFPGWPLDVSADVFDDLAAAHTPIDRTPTPVVVSHDIDSAEGLRLLVDRFLEIEERAGARSTNYIVPCGWPLDHGLLREIVARGHTIGVHGFDHSNKTPHASPADRRDRLRRGFDALAAYGPRGYRAPSLIRTAGLLDDLAELYDYDSSIPTSGGPFPAFNNGCASVRPFVIGRTLELPVTMRRDGSLLFMGHRPDEIGEMWRHDAAAVHRARGVVMVLTHCERRFTGNEPMLDTYRQFLEHLASTDTFEWSTPETVIAARVATSVA